MSDIRLRLLEKEFSIDPYNSVLLERLAHILKRTKGNLSSVGISDLFLQKYLERFDVPYSFMPNRGHLIPFYKKTKRGCISFNFKKEGGLITLKHKRLRFPPPHLLFANFRPPKTLGGLLKVLEKGLVPEFPKYLKGVEGLLYEAAKEAPFDVEIRSSVRAKSYLTKNKYIYSLSLKEPYSRDFQCELEVNRVPCYDFLQFTIQENLRFYDPDRGYDEVQAASLSGNLYQSFGISPPSEEEAEEEGIDLDNDYVDFDVVANPQEILEQLIYYFQEVEQYLV